MNATIAISDYTDFTVLPDCVTIPSKDQSGQVHAHYATLTIKGSKRKLLVGAHGLSIEYKDIETDEVKEYSGTLPRSEVANLLDVIPLTKLKFHNDTCTLAHFKNGNSLDMKTVAEGLLELVESENWEVKNDPELVDRAIQSHFAGIHEKLAAFAADPKTENADAVKACQQQLAELAAKCHALFAPNSK